MYQNIISSMNLELDDNDLPEDYLVFNVGPKGTYDHLELTINELLDETGPDDTTSFLIAIGK